MQDVGASGRSRASRQGNRRGPSERRAEHAKASVDRPEFVAPFGDAVRLVDREERHRRACGHQASRQRCQSLRRAVQEGESPADRRVEDDAPLPDIQLAVDVRRCDATAAQRADLVLHQRDEG